MNKTLKNILITLSILIISFAGSLFMQTLLKTDAFVPSVFILSVLLVSLLTDGYIFGILAALLSVLSVNFAFTFPFFEFNFTIHENAVSAIIMIVVTTVTSTLTTQLKKHRVIKDETEKEKMRANLLRAVSHDLRTPLTSVYGASSTVIDNYDLLTDTDKKELISGIKEDSKWLIRMVENLLSVTKIDSSGVNLVKSPIVLEELVYSVLLKFGKNYPDCKVEISMPEDFITVKADPMLIEQVIINLLENAVIHAKGMTKLKLLTSKEDSYVYFTVEDNGCGIPKEKLKTWFKNYRLSEDSYTDSKRKGMGIGLSLCASIIKAHGSKITAKNLTPSGMRFEFYLEAEEENDE